MSSLVGFALYDWHYFFAQLVAGLTLGSLYALLALGYTMVYGILKLLNFAHGDVYMIGAYIGYFVLTALGGSLAPTVPTPI
jgi:branched-chain amino acid transport system permease protein